MTAEHFLRHASALPPSGTDPPGTGCIDPCPELATDQTLTLSRFQPHGLRNALFTGSLGLLVGLALALGLAAHRKQRN